MEQKLGGCVGSPIKQRPTRVEITRVFNGFIIGGCGVDQKIANTLPEALELLRKELE